MLEDIALVTLEAAKALRRAQESDKDRAALRDELRTTESIVRRRCEELSTTAADDLAHVSASCSSARASLSRLLAGQAVLSIAGLPNPSVEAAAFISKLRPGDIVRLRKGEYRGPFVIPAGVTVLGDGRSQTVLRSGTGESNAALPCVELAAGGALHGVTVTADGKDNCAVRFTAASDDEEGLAKVVDASIVSTNCPCVVVDRGCEAFVEHVSCDMAAAGATCISVAQDGELVAQDVNISVTVAAKKKPSSDHALSVGVRVTGGVVDLAGCTFTGFGTAVRVAGEAARPCTISECRIQGCSEAGIDASAGCTSLVVSSTSVSGSGGAGIVIGPTTDGATLRCCTVRDCKLSGVVLAGIADPAASVRILDCSIASNGQYGVLASKPDSPDAVSRWLTTVPEGNDITDNALGPVKLDP